MNKNSYSQNTHRNRIFIKFLAAPEERTLQNLIDLGYRLMRRARIHPHFFGDNSLLHTAESLACYSLNAPKPLLSPLALHEAESIINVFEKRISERIPVEYLTNEAWYSGNAFYVNENVLIPRSIMNTRFEEFLNDVNWKAYRVLDLCTGSGCIGITLALLNPRITVDLVDISLPALDVAKINIKKYALEKRVRCIQSDLFTQVQDKYDLIITNPPYVSRKEYQSCPKEFKKEPRIAFEGGKDGLDLVHRILAQAIHHLYPEGTLIAEVGVTAAKRMKRQYRKLQWEWFKYKKTNGKTAFLAMDCAFRCKAEALSAYFLQRTNQVY